MRCKGVQKVAKPAYLEGFPFPALLRVAPYRVPDGIRVVSVAPRIRLTLSPMSSSSEVQIGKLFIMPLTSELLPRRSLVNRSKVSLTSTSPTSLYYNGYAYPRLP